MFPVSSSMILERLGFLAQMTDGHEAIMERYDNAESKSEYSKPDSDVKIIREISQSDHPPKNGHGDAADSKKSGDQDPLKSESSRFIFTIVEDDRFQPIIFPGDK